MGEKRKWQKEREVHYAFPQEKKKVEMSVNFLFCSYFYVGNDIEITYLEGTTWSGCGAKSKEKEKKVEAKQRNYPSFFQH